MKYLFYSILIFVFTSCNNNSSEKQTDEKSTHSEQSEILSESESITENTPTNTESQTQKTEKELKTVEDIREEYQVIMSKIKDGKIIPSSFDYMCNEELEGKLTYFSENGELRRIVRQSGYDHGELIREIFLKDNKPFFIFHHMESWSFDVEANQEHAIRKEITEKRFYIADNKLIKCLEKEFVNRSAAKNNPTSVNIPNKDVECSSLSDLMTEYELVLKYKNQTEKMGCLE